MASFMLITEGPTDQEVLKAILTGYYGDEPDFPFLRPRRDATDESRQAGRGGWEMVFEHCENSDELRDDLVINDYLVIQIDTDCGDHSNFGVPLTSGGEDRPEQAIVEDVRNLLISKLGAEFYEDFRERIIFAISVHSLECWLLPLHAPTAKAAKQTKNCAKRLGRSIQQELTKNDGETCRTYQTLAKPYRKRATIEQFRKHNKSLDIFLSSLPQADA